MGSIDKTSLAKRMKDLEHRARIYLPRRTYTMIRVDGKAFHTYTRGMERPYDMRLVEAMRRTMQELCDGSMGCVLGYCQSDEISLLLTDFKNVNSEAWFDNNKSKLESITASLATAAFNEAARDLFGENKPNRHALFDSRAWTVPSLADAAVYFRWRQEDAERNSVSMLAQNYFSHNDLQGVSKRDMLDRLVLEHEVNWNDQPTSFKRGSVCVRRTETKEFSYVHKKTGETMSTGPVERSFWSNEDAPIFTQSDFLLDTIPQVEPVSLEDIRQLTR